MDDELWGRPPADRRRRGSGADGELVAAIGRGDQAALAEVFSRESGRMLAVARGRCGRDRAEDVVQEVLLTLWHRPERYDPTRGSLRTFLVMQAHRRATDVLRSDGARSAREQAVGRRDVAVSTRDDERVEDEVLGRLSGEALHTALETVSATGREAISLAYFGGCTYREVADVLDRPVGTVKSQIRQGLRELRRGLGATEGREEVVRHMTVASTSGPAVPSAKPLSRLPRILELLPPPAATS